MILCINYEFLINSRLTLKGTEIRCLENLNVEELV